MSDVLDEVVLRLAGLDRSRRNCSVAPEHFTAHNIARYMQFILGDAIRGLGSELRMKNRILNIARKALPTGLRNKIFNLGFQLSPGQFEKFSYLYGGAPKMELGLRALRDRGFNPKVIFDIGAFEGSFCAMARRIWPCSHIVMFEGNQEKKPILEAVAKRENADVRFVLLGPEDGMQVDFFVMESGSSVMQENSPLDRRVVRQETSCLDTVASGISPDFIKLDVQGFELEVLRGADAALRSAQAVMMEVSLIGINEGAPLFAEVVGFMAQHGFEVADVMEIHRRPLDQATNQVDLFFVRIDHALLADRRHFA